MNVSLTVDLNWAFVYSVHCLHLSESLCKLIETSHSVSAAKELHSIRDSHPDPKICKIRPHRWLKYITLLYYSRLAGTVRHCRELNALGHQ